jgi:hypothetical protein
MVERTRMAKVRRREMAWISWFGTARFIGSKRHWIRVERCASQLSCCHYNKQEIWLESRADFHMESAIKGNSLGFPIHLQMSEEETWYRDGIDRSGHDQGLQQG